jgi:hypothetical protein
MNYPCPKNSRSLKSRNLSSRTILVALAALVLLALATTSAFVAGTSGAIFTTDSSCGGTNINNFATKPDVYLNGGPTHPHAAGLPDGLYYVQVTDPSGVTVLGTSVGSANPTPAQVTGGAFVNCYQLTAILIKGTDSTPGYDNTPNPGGEYKLWVSMDSTFPNAGSKTDNFKVQNADCTANCGPADTVSLSVRKFFDNNGNGSRDPGEPLIDGWQMRIVDSIDFTRYTPVDLILAPDTYTVTEADAVETNWTHSGGSYSINGSPSVPLLSPFTTAIIPLPNNGDSGSVVFGNYCTVPSGGKTIGFWSNKNGQGLLTNSDFISLTTAPLVKANGTAQDFTASLANNKTAVNSWLLSANATNMAYMLSAQLTAMKLNVAHGFVDGNAFYLPAGKTINQIIADAEALLASSGGNYVVTAGALRTNEERVKNYLDQVNNGAAVIPVQPCSFSFAP